MNLKLLITGFLKITWKKVFATILFPFAAFSILLFAFVFDEVFGLGGNVIVNTMYLFANYFYLFIFLPLIFVDIDFSSSLVLGIALVLTIVWWYFLSCALIFILEKAPGPQFKNNRNNILYKQ